MTELKPLHANWLIECYNSLTSPENQGVILAWWRASGISEALAAWSVSFNAAMDPFHDIDPFATGIQRLINTSVKAKAARETSPIRIVNLTYLECSSNNSSSLKTAH